MRCQPMICSTSRTQFFLVLGTGTVYVDAELSVIRRRAVAAGFEEELVFLNHTSKLH